MVQVERASLYRRLGAHSDETISRLHLDAIGHVRWWPEGRAEVTLHQILVHMIAETNRHAGHADILLLTALGEIVWGISLLPRDDRRTRGRLA